ncbi:hypothetical protein QYE76_017324 [Lolium multiflorum]|uniref:Uncharacterized protein n=1 Tax=Lolium multiflorum TaxID=4521 RepID=A0AAD8QGY1_LOLMU|nr:hypothetical protein QYE76_017324 [Lolium multiflorum]
MLATDMPKLIKDAIIREQRSFFWSSGRDDGGGSCAVAWKDVCRPVEYGGLGVLDLKRMGWALCARWAWLRRSDDSCPWTNFPVHLGRHVEALVYAATTATLGNGTKLLFWSDRWLAGQSIADLAPAVVAAVNPRVIKRRSVASALPENAWIRDITGTLSTEASIQFLHLVDITAEQELHPGSQDTLTWNLTESGSYSAKSAYKAFFQGSTFSPHHNSIWECWSPLICKIWHDILSKLNLLGYMPRANESFNDWFATAADNASPAMQKVLLWFLVVVSVKLGRPHIVHHTVELMEK